MDPQRAMALISDALDALSELPADSSTADFKTWRETTHRTLSRVFGEDDRLSDRFLNSYWSPMAFPASGSDYRDAFEAGRSTATALLRTALHDLGTLGSVEERSSDFDPDLWRHVSHLYEQGHWAQVASQSVIFCEDRIREWAGVDEDQVGERLWTRVLHHADGRFPLGRTSGEAQGWYRLGMGLSMAARNVDTHRIQKRDDLREYAVGVLGTASLLLTQLRYEHGNRFLGD